MNKTRAVFVSHVRLDLPHKKMVENKWNSRKSAFLQPPMIMKPRSRVLSSQYLMMDIFTWQRDDNLLFPLVAVGGVHDVGF